MHGPRFYTLDKFAQHPFYQEVNRRLVALTGLHKGQRVVDLGAGTGAVTRLLAEQVATNDGAEVIAVEPSETAIEVAKRNLENIRDAWSRFIQGSAERLASWSAGPSTPSSSATPSTWCRRRTQVLQEIKQTLREDGTFSFNTSFYQGAEPPESEQFYRKWMMRALRALKTEYGLSPDKTKVEARHRLTADDYIKLLEDNGFKIEKSEVVQVQMPLSGFEGISEYSLWIEGVLPGVPLEAGAPVAAEGRAARRSRSWA